MSGFGGSGAGGWPCFKGFPHNFFSFFFFEGGGGVNPCHTSLIINEMSLS